MKLLHLDSSILGKNSASRLLSSEVVAKTAALHPGIEITYRDLGADPALHLSGAHMAAWQGAPVKDQALGADLKAGDAYVTELFDADIIVIGAPMYNFAVPSQLKAWIDRIVVTDRTFKYNEKGEIQTLLPPGKKVIIASTRGNIYAPGTPQAALEHQESYLKGVFGFLGVHDVAIVRAEGLAFGPEARNAAMARARADLASLAV
jgi:FMN-dependent NADH-azoreductase